VSLTITGLVLKRDRLMGIGQAITMPLFFASNALYPLWVMPGWLQVLSAANPLTYEVSALRGLLVGRRRHCGWTSRPCSWRRPPRSPRPRRCWAGSRDEAPRRRDADGRLAPGRW
jgi:hypothetical protein